MSDYEMYVIAKAKQAEMLKQAHYARLARIATEAKRSSQPSFFDNAAALIRQTVGSVRLAFSRKQSSPAQEVPCQ